jgi:hypothetical protein
MRMCLEPKGMAESLMPILIDASGNVIHLCGGACSMSETHPPEASPFVTVF